MAADADDGDAQSLELTYIIQSGRSNSDDPVRYCHGVTKTPDVRVRRATEADEAEVARFEEAFDNRVLLDEMRRFLGDDRHHLMLGYVEDRPAGFVSAVEVFRG